MASMFARVVFSIFGSRLWLCKLGGHWCLCVARTVSGGLLQWGTNCLKFQLPAFSCSAVLVFYQVSSTDAVVPFLETGLPAYDKSTPLLSFSFVLFVYVLGHHGCQTRLSVPGPAQHVKPSDFDGCSTEAAMWHCELVVVCRIGASMSMPQYIFDRLQRGNLDMTTATDRSRVRV